MDETELTPCPFCGSAALLEPFDGGWILGCTKRATLEEPPCPLSPVFTYDDNRDAAIARWNCRPNYHLFNLLDWLGRKHPQIKAYYARGTGGYDLAGILNVLDPGRPVPPHGSGPVSSAPQSTTPSSREG